MCLMVWVGSSRPLPRLAAPESPDGDRLLSFHRVEPVEDDAPIRGRFSLPSVSYVGSCDGCGCGFNSQDYALWAFSTVSEVTPLLGAMLDHEQARFLTEQRVRERLAELIVGALADGPVEVYGCWSGSEGEAIHAEAEVGPEHFAEMLRPIAERVRYRVVSAPPSPEA